MAVVLILLALIIAIVLVLIFGGTEQRKKRKEIYKEQEKKKKSAKKEIKERNKEARKEAKRFVDIMDETEEVQQGTTVDAKEEINTEEVKDILNEPKSSFVDPEELWTENDFWHEERPKEQPKPAEPIIDEPKPAEPIMEEPEPTIEEPTIEPIIDEKTIQEPEEEEIEFNSDLFGNWNDEENK